MGAGGRVAREAGDIGDAQAEGAGAGLGQAQAVGLAQLPAGEAPLGSLGRELELGSRCVGAWRSPAQVGGCRRFAGNACLASGDVARIRGCVTVALAKEGVEASLEGTQGITGGFTKRLAHGQGLTGRLPK